jgi:hypothetical protein
VPDGSIVIPDIHTAPKDYKLVGAQEIALKSVRAVIDGTGAGADFLPTLQLLDPNLNVMWEGPAPNVVVAGASADVSWFPGLNLAASINPTGLPVYEPFTPVVKVGGVPLTGMSINASCWSQGVQHGFFSTFATIVFGADVGAGTDSYQIQLAPNIGVRQVFSANGWIGVGFNAFQALGPQEFPLWIDGSGFVWALNNDTSVSELSPAVAGFAPGDTLWLGSWQGPIILTP